MATQVKANGARVRIPRATYRVQFHRQFTFKDAEALVPYLYDLGISDLYASPILRAVPGSTHGYDVCDPSQLNPELGTAQDFERLSAALQQRGMGLLLDIVPNHMGIAGACNDWWTDVLENGPSSRYAHYFDIDWNPIKPELANTVLVPVLEDHYGKVLDSGKLQLEYTAGAFTVVYGEHRFPIAPRTYDRILRHALDDLLATVGADSEPMQEYQSILTAMSYLPRRSEVEAERIAERHREKEVMKRRLAALVEAHATIRVGIEAALQAFNGVPGNARSFDRLDELLSAQAYRLTFWRVAGEEINYRRFFDVNTMAAIRSELPEVFDATHALVLRLVREGHVTGLRVDHPDGLADPTRYFQQLQASCWTDDSGESQESTSEASGDRRCLYVVAEKILSEAEPLPSDWAVSGTTGYDFMNLANGLFVDSGNERAFDTLYSEFAPDVPEFQKLHYDSKQRTMRDSLAGEINSLAHRLERMSESNRYTRDFTLNGLLHVIRDFIACLSIYRTYVMSPESVSERDRWFIDEAIREAQRRNPHISRSIFAFLRETLLLRNVDAFGESLRNEVLSFVMRLQQMTGPVMAKSIEDTAFYVYNRFVSLNEVGGNPASFGVSPEDFHKQTVKRAAQWRHTTLSSSTHDTKRSEDVRARLNVLSEMPDEWGDAVRTWRTLNTSHRQSLDGIDAPDANDEYLLYQTLVGAMPDDADAAQEDSWADFCERMVGYMAKATKEAKVHTGWTNPNDEYDQAVADFVRAVLDPERSRAFLDLFRPFANRVAYVGRFNALSQTLLKLASPGVPDTYRGTELWDYSLVDPDNRRPVDYARVTRALADVKARSDAPDCDRRALCAELLQNAPDGLIKLYTIYRALAYRLDHERLFADGEYVPVEAQGVKAQHVCAFARMYNGEMALVIVPRLVVGLAGGAEKPPLGEVWGETTLPLPDGFRDATMTNVYTGETLSSKDGVLPLSQLVAGFPVALWVAERS